MCRKTPPSHSRKFTRTREDFTCRQCGAFVTGSGYTNHCPHCLWSRHVDQMPGDRMAACTGMMEPIAVELTHGDTFWITHRCCVCGHTTRMRAADNDDRDALIARARRAAEGVAR